MGTINWGRGLIRVWFLFTLCWIAGSAFYIYSDGAQYWSTPFYSGRERIAVVEGCRRTFPGEMVQLDLGMAFRHPRGEIERRSTFIVSGRQPFSLLPHCR